MIRNVDTQADVAAHAVEALLGVILAEGRKPVEATDMPDGLISGFGSKIPPHRELHDKR